MRNIININSLTFQYRRKPLFLELELTIGAGRVYGLLGRNGTGKTTLLNLISGLLLARHGSIDTLGENPNRRSAKLLAQIFFLPEQVILPSMSSRQYLRFYSVFYPNFSAEDFERYADALEINTSGKLHQLSHGQQKKFLLAFGLACHCPLNLLDEPTNGLDIPSKSVFRRLVAGAVDEHKCFVISTHQVRDVENLIDNIIALDDGKVVFEQTLANIADTLSIGQQTIPPKEDVIYAIEDGLGSYSVVQKNTSGKAGSVDLELLFSAIMHEGEQLRQAFRMEAADNV